MSAQAAVRTSAPTRRRRGRAVATTRVVLAGTAAAWLALLWMWLPQGPSARPWHAHGTVVTGSQIGTDAAGAASVDPFSLPWVSGWLLMTAAMMWPLLVPALVRVVEASFPRWRLALGATALLTATALWLGLGLTAAAVAHIASVPAGSVAWQLGFLAVAALWWGSARRYRLLSRCAKLPPVPPAGARGLVGAMRIGFLSWRRCALVCGPLMVAMVVGHAPVVLVAASLAVWWEARHPRAWHDRVPVALIAVAALGALAHGVLGP